MPLSVGIVGLPNSGKSTLFNTLIGEHLAKVADYPFTTIEPNVGVIAVSDERLDKIAKLLGEQVKKVPATIEFIDVAGLVEGAHQGKGLGNQFLAQIAAVDAIVLLVRVFALPPGPADPKGAAELVQLELKLGGIEKPTLIIENTNQSVSKANQVNAKTGEGVGELIKQSYQLLDLISFYTLRQAQGKPDQVQAWPISRGATALEAAAKIHTDFAKSFIKAEVVSYQDFVDSGGSQQAKARGKLRFEGRDYVISAGDLVKVRFSGEARSRSSRKV